MKIATIKDKRLDALVNGPAGKSVKGLQPQEAAKIRKMIQAVLDMDHPNQLKSWEGWKAHDLEPRFPGTWSLWVTGNYRLIFYVDTEQQEVRDMDYVDYH